MGDRVRWETIMTDRCWTGSNFKIAVNVRPADKTSVNVNKSTLMLLEDAIKTSVSRILHFKRHKKA